jgi:hypothetical protein
MPDVVVLLKECLNATENFDMSFWRRKKHRLILDVGFLLWL